MWRSPGHVYGASIAHSAQPRLVPSTGSGTGLDSKRRECDEKAEDLEKPGSWWSEREPWAPVKCRGGAELQMWAFLLVPGPIPSPCLLGQSWCRGDNGVDHELGSLRLVLAP